ncbi:MAG: hypothetical protein ACTSU6_04390 [Candidatus Njordarchaeales archaeon]
MFHWDTTVVKNALSKALPNYKITLEGPGGDFDTTAVWVSRPNPDYGVDEYADKTSSIGVWGMNTGHVCITTPDNVDVEIVFAGSGQRYGMESASVDEFALYAEVVRVVRSLGVDDVDSGGWKGHF